MARKYKRMWRKYRKRNKGALRIYRPVHPVRYGGRIFTPYKNAMSLIVGGFPKSRVVKLRYMIHFQLNALSADTLASKIFRANDPRQPENTTQTTSHQPMNWDIFAGLYRNYVVLGSKITIAASSTTNINSSGSGVFGILKEDNATALTAYSVRGMMENAFGKYRYINTNANYNSQPVAKLTMTYSAKKWFGLKDVKDNKGKLGAAVNTSPTELAYFGVWSGHPDPTYDPPPISCSAVVDYIVQFYEPKEQSVN